MTATRENAPAPRWLTVNLILALGLAAMPLTLQLPLEISAFFFGTLLLRLLLLRRSAPRLPKAVLVLLTAGALLVALGKYQHLFGRDAGTGLLTLMLALKLLELHSRRDVLVTVLLGFFFIVVQFLFVQTLAVTGYLILITFWLLALVSEMHRFRRSRSLLRPVRLTLVLTAQATPVMLVLFLLFPRLSAPLWSLYSPSSHGVTGFSDRLEPGSISQLSLSDEIAFRVDFHGRPPPSTERYWRGQVFTETDGRRWQARNAPLIHEERLAPQSSGQGLDYTITLEPHGRQWMFFLEQATVIPPRTRMTADLQLLSQAPVNQRLSYGLTSYPRLHSQPLDLELRTLTLALPDSVTPRMRRMVGDWQIQSAVPAEVIQKALQHFRREEFFYTLAPPRLMENPADQFLFETRSGFCEHYASSFVLLMRIAGIPSRVVTGYQGGEYNHHGDYLIVRQSDAHAWAEVWLEAEGWVRVDPTAAVAPERVERWFDPARLVEGAPIRFGLGESTWIRRLAHEAGLMLDALNTGWRRWVLHYSTEKQSTLLERLGLGFLSYERLGFGLVALSALMLGAVTWHLLRQDRVPQDPVQKLYLRVCARLARLGVPRRPTEGPRDYGDRVLAQYPELGDQLRPILALYQELRYGRSGSSQDRQRLQRLVRGFHP